MLEGGKSFSSNTSYTKGCFYTIKKASQLKKLNRLQPAQLLQGAAVRTRASKA